MIKVKVTVDIEYEGKEEIIVEVSEFNQEKIWEAVVEYMNKNYYYSSFTIVHYSRPVLV